MIEITYNAFSFLRATLGRKNLNYLNAAMQLPEGSSVREMIDALGLKMEEVEGVFVNNKIVSKDTILKTGDRVGLVPPGTPGPYRVMLGMVPVNGKGKGR